MYQEIIIIEDEDELLTKLKKIFETEKDFIFNSIKSKDIDDGMNTIPDLIIINENENTKLDAIEILDIIRNQKDNTITPIMVVSSKIDKEHRIEILKKDAEYFIKAPVDDEYLYYTIKNIITLMSCNRKVSPLTGLPGNIQIQVEIRKRLLKKDDFAILYFDLDNFKEYNDTYGFLKGDEIIKFTAKTIAKILHNHEIENAFLGHIGGDDFVAVVPEADYDKLCQDIIIAFDNNVEKFFNEEDFNRGYLEVANRKGIIEQFPITSISIGVVKVKTGEYTNPLEIGEVGAQVKHLAKKQIGSSYVINRRIN